MAAPEVVNNSGYPAPNFDNYTAFTPPQCTWFAHGRMKEIGKKTITFSATSGLDGSKWWTLVNNLSQSSSATSNCIACFKGPSAAGHVVFVYGQMGDWIYFSDSNHNQDNKKVYRQGESDFQKLCGENNFQGYLIP